MRAISFTAQLHVVQISIIPFFVFASVLGAPHQTKKKKILSKLTSWFRVGAPKTCSRRRHRVDTFAVVVS